MQNTDQILQTHGISRASGFLSESADCLPDKFAAWEDLAGSLTACLTNGSIRQAVDKLPLLDSSGLGEDAKLLARARLLLTTITQTYVFGPSETVGTLPQQIAKPLCAISRILDLPPILSYTDYVLGNWQLVDPTGPISLENMQARIGMNGGLDEGWFILVHVAVEAEAGALVADCVDARLAADAGDADGLLRILTRLKEALERLKITFLRMREQCDPHVYFLRVRPFTHGWHNNPGFDGGMIYEGVEEFGGKPMSFRGETGAQSSVIPTVDIALDIQHPDDKMNEHLDAMRDYMPREHRRFLDWMSTSSIREFVSSRNEANEDSDSRLLNAYNACCECLRDFRTTHMKIAHEYVFAHRDTAIDSTANPASVGTGGTPPMDYLCHHRDSTDESIIRKK